MLHFIGKISRLWETAVVHKQGEFIPRKREERGNRPANTQVLPDKGKSLTVSQSSVKLSSPSDGKHLFSSQGKNLESHHPFRVYQSMIGTEDIFNVIVDSQGGARVVPKPFIPSPERGLVNLSREHPKIISPKVPYSPTGADLGALFFPCLGIGFAAWWGLLPDQVIMSSPSLSLLDPSCLLPLKEGILEGSSSGVVTEQAFDPKVSPEVGDELKVALTEINSAIRDHKYGSAAVLLLGAVAALVLLSGSGSESR